MAALTPLVAEVEAVTALQTREPTLKDTIAGWEQLLVTLLERTDGEIADKTRRIDDLAAEQADLEARLAENLRVRDELVADVAALTDRVEKLRTAIPADTPLTQAALDA